MQAKQVIKQQIKIFLSYSRRDSLEIATHIRAFFETKGLYMWQDIQKIIPGAIWENQVKDAITHSDIVIAILTPKAVRRSTLTLADDSTCLDEIYLARYHQPPIPIIPILAIPCEPPLSIA